MDKEKYASGPSSWLDMHNFIGDLVASSASASGQLLKYPNQQSLRSAWETMGPEAAVPKASRQAPSAAARANQGKSMAGYGLQSGESSEESVDCDEQQTVQPYTCTCPGCPLSSLTGALSLQSLKPRENSSQAQHAVTPESTLSAQAKGPGAVPLSLGLCLGLGLSLEEGSSESVSTSNSTSGRPQHQDKASLIMKGPTQPVLEGDEVTLECVDSESQFNLSSLHFEKLSKHMQRWYRLDVDDYSYLYRRCFLYDVQVSRDNGRLFLTLPRVQTWTAGPYRCVADDDTSLDNSSTPFTISVHYMRDLSVYRSGVGSFARYFSSPQDLRVSLGSDVELECSTSASETPNYFWAKEGEDWIVPSNKLRLEKVRDMDTGKYTCTAQHPTISTLMKRQTISITVLPEDAAWYKTTTGHITLMVSGLLVALFVVILSMTIFLCHQAKQRKGKGPIDDRSQKKPIYKNSVESLPSTTGDKEPLV